MNGVLTLLAILYFIGPIAAAKFPSHLQRCHYGDTECIAQRINSYVREYKKGFRDINLVGIDPLHVNKVDIIQSNDSPVSVNLSFKDILYSGLSNMKVKKIVGFGKDPATSKFEIYANVNQLSLIAQYKVKGKIIILPVVGNGAANLTFDNVDFSIKLIPKVETRKGKNYLTFSDVKLDFQTTRLWMYFGNLFNGDKALGDGTNKFLDEHWLEILNDLKPVLIIAIGDIIKGVVNPIFNKFPYDQLFL